MKGTPLLGQKSVDPKLAKRVFNLSQKFAANVVEVLTFEELCYFEKNLSHLKVAVEDGLRSFNNNVILSEAGTAEKHLRDKFSAINQTGPTFDDWLTAREGLHMFLTGEMVNLREMFEIPDALRLRSDIMPVFRPVGVNNRDAVNWKNKLGINVGLETDVMKYKNSKGSKDPELYFISRSLKPDADTLGSNAKCPDDLVKVKLERNQCWLNLYGYADADNLHFVIIGEHLDPKKTLTWFPEDRLPSDFVAYGCWDVNDNQVKFNWNNPQDCDPDIGARRATRLSRK